jgi:hypothetical protein
LRDSISVPQLVFLPRAVISGNAAIFSPRLQRDVEERGIPAARGRKWSAVQVARLLEAAGCPLGDGVNVAV